MASQEPSAATSQGSRPLRTFTRLVQVNVIVQDRKGQLVQGLTREDFVLYDEDQAQEVAFLSAGAGGEEQPTAAPNSYSNRREVATRGSSGAIVILFDALNTQPEDLKFGRAQLRKFLEKAEPGTPVALYALERSPRLLHALTRDPRLLIPVLEKYQAPVFSDVDASEPKEQNTGLPVDGWENELRRITAPGAMRRRADITLRSLHAVSRQMGGIPGHKSLIWMAGSFPGWSVIASSFFGLANVAVYPMDVRGMSHTITPEDSLPHSWRAAMQGREPMPGSYYPNPTSYATPMDVLAAHTGGRAIYGNNDLAGALGSVFAEERATYVLGFYPTHNEWTNQFRRLKVEVRRSGVRVRYRQGYFAVAETYTDEQTRMARLREAAESPFENTGLGLTARLAMTEDGRPTVDVEMEKSELSIVDENGKQEFHVDVLFAQRGADGKLIKFRGESLRIALQGKSIQERGNRIAFRYRLTPEPGATQLCVVVLDQPSSAIGSVILPLP